MSDPTNNTGQSSFAVSPNVDLSVDLSGCDREPIQTPGAIQPHGFLLGLDDRNTVQLASGNAGAFLHRPLAAVFGQTLSELLGEGYGTVVGDALDALGALEAVGMQPTEATEKTEAAAAVAGMILPTVRLPKDAPDAPDAADALTFEVLAHRAHGDAAAGAEGRVRTIVEFERVFAPADPQAITSRLYNFVARIRTLHNMQSICEAAVAAIRELTGCDRVVLYRFDREGHGVVLAEERAEEHFASYLGLHFPATDVPAQARKLYLLNRVRIIPDVDYVPSPLYAAVGAGSALAPDVDLSSSILRSVSPVHRQYMRNMGTLCSMSVSILVEGQLWGLVSCHHHQARYVPLQLRSACDFVMQIVASQIESQQNAAVLRLALEAREIQGRLLSAMANPAQPSGAAARTGYQHSYMDGLATQPDLLQQLLHADGAAMVVGTSVRCFGITPPEAEVLPLVDWLRESRQDELFITSSLATLYPRAKRFSATSSGVVAISVSRLHNTRVLWFRREVVETVRWAGDPSKPASPGAQPKLDPRQSFEEWLQIVRGTATPWTEQETEAARAFRSAVLELVLRRAEELAELASGLQVANEELESFSYSVSHDLRAPFRHISGFSQMLKEHEAENLSEKGRHYLATIMESARFAGLLVDSLLEFARFARSSIAMRPVAMEQLVDAEWQAVLYDELHEVPHGSQSEAAQGRKARASDRIEFSRTPLPRVMGDPALLRQVIRNLFSNAVKYTARQPKPTVRVAAESAGTEFVFSIADNGAGFDQQYAGKLFGVFQRLHRSEDFEGTGIGLANVRRIIGRHGGRTWAEGKLEQGATFFFALPAVFPPEEL